MTDNGPDRAGHSGLICDPSGIRVRHPGSADALGGRSRLIVNRTGPSTVTVAQAREFPLDRVLPNPAGEFAGTSRRV